MEPPMRTNAAGVPNVSSKAVPAARMAGVSAGRVTGAARPSGLFLLRRRLDDIVEAGHLDAARVLIFEPGQDGGEAAQGVGSGAAVEAGMQIMRGAMCLDLRVDEPAQARAERRHAGREH